MQKINNAYITRAKENSFEEIRSQYPELVGGYAILSNLPLKVGKEILRLTSECDEDIHPLMRRIITLSCIDPPIATVDSFLAKTANGDLMLDSATDDMLEQLQAWLHENIKQLEVLSSLCQGSKILVRSDNRLELHDFNITPDIEKNFLIEKREEETDKERIVRIKREKMISAIAALMLHADVQAAEQENRIDLVKLFSFNFAWQLLRFAAGAAIVDGVLWQGGRRDGGRKGPDRKGLLTMISQFSKQYPDDGPTKLWKIITRHVVKEKKYSPLKKYYIHFEIDPTATSDPGGKLIQTYGKKKPHSMGFQAFSNALKYIRN